eukprot:COSAG02_NODE_4952_length_4788_cov_252.664747_2_plen_562_part_00
MYKFVHSLASRGHFVADDADGSGRGCGGTGMEGATTPRSAAGRDLGPERTMSAVDLHGLSNDQGPAAQSSLPMVEFYRRSGSLEPQLIAAYGSPRSFPTHGPRVPDRAAEDDSGAPRKRRAVSPAATEEMTPLERRVVLCNRASYILMTAGGGLTSAAGLQTKLNLVDYDLGRSAVATATIISTISGFSLFLTPIVGAASDTLGRKRFQILDSFARAGWYYFLSSPMLCRSISHYSVAAVVFHGVLSAGAMLIREASLDDLFGQRVSLRAGISAKTGFYCSIVSMLAPIAGAEMSRRGRHGLAHGIGVALSFLQVGVSLMMPETLREDERRLFVVKAANPISNMGVLFRNGPGLRGLAILNFLYHLSNGCNQNKGEYAMRALSWVPEDLSYMQSFEGLTNVFSQRVVVMRMLKKLGAGGAFRTGSLFSCAAYVGIGLSWAVGSQKWQKSLVFLLAHVVWCGGHVGPLALRAVTIKQGLSVKPPLGRGELNAALGGMGSLIGMTSPLFWGRLFRFFSTAGEGTIWHNPGGGFLLAGAMRLSLRLLFELICRLYKEDLFIIED